jgi:histidinol-phosphate aminotransferase
MKIKEHLQPIKRYETAYPNRLGKVRLDRNERVSPWPEALWQEIQAAISPDVLMSYPEFGALYDKLAAHLQVKPEQLLLAHGSDAALKSIFEVYIGPQDEAVVLQPTYAMYPIYARMMGAEAVEVPFQADLSLPLSLIKTAITPRTRIVCLPNPNQPIERVFEAAELEEMADLALRHDFLLVVDEAYHYFYGESAIGKIEDNPNLMVTRSFSKAFGLAGLRAGLIIAKAERIADIKRVKPISEVNGVAVRLIDFFLDRMEVVAAYVAEVEQGRAYIKERAAGLGLATFGNTGNSILVRLKDAEQVRYVIGNCKDNGYLIKGGFPPPAESYIRITLGNEEYMRGAMDLIERYLSC